jgi:hypothetical protein
MPRPAKRASSPAHLPVSGDWQSVITKIGDELARLDPSISRPIAN